MELKELDYYSPLLQSPSIFNESLLLTEMWIPGFNGKMTQKLLQHLGKMAQIREFVSNSSYATLYNLIEKKKINLQFAAELPSISDFYFVSDANSYSVIGGYNFQTRKIEIYVKWTADSSFMVNYSVEEIANALKSQKLEDGELSAVNNDYIQVMNSLCNKIYAIIVTEGLLIYDYKSKGKLSRHEIVRKWYFEYFKDMINDTLKRTSVGENLGALIAERYGPYMFEAVESKIIEGKHPGVKIDVKGASPDLDMEGIPIIKKDDKETLDIWEDAIKKIMDNNVSKLNLDRQTYKDVEELAKEFGEFGKFLYDNRDLRLNPDNLAQSPDSNIDIYKSSNEDEEGEDEAKEQQKVERERKLALKRAAFIDKNKKQLYDNESGLVKDDLEYKWYKRLKDDPEKNQEKEENRKIVIGQIEKIESGNYEKIEPGQTYIAKFLLPKKEDEDQDIKCSINDIKTAYEGVKKSNDLYNSSILQLDKLIKENATPEKIRSASLMVISQRNQRNAYYTDFWQLMRSNVTKDTPLEHTFNNEKPDFANIDRVLMSVNSAINNYQNNAAPDSSYLGDLMFGRNQFANKARTYEHAGGLVKYDNTSARIQKYDKPRTIMQLIKQNTTGSAARQLDALEDNIKESIPSIYSAISLLDDKEKKNDPETRKKVDEIYSNVFKQIQQCGFIGRAYTGQLKQGQYTDDQLEAIKQERQGSKRHQMLERAIIHKEDVKLIDAQQKRLLSDVPKKTNEEDVSKGMKAFIDKRYGNDYLKTVRFGIDNLKLIASKANNIPRSKNEAEKMGIDGWFDSGGRQLQQIGRVLDQKITGKNGEVNLMNATDEDILSFFQRNYLGENPNDGSNSSIRASRVDAAMDNLFGKLKEGITVARNIEHEYNRHLLASDNIVKNKSNNIQLDNYSSVQRALQLLVKKDSNIDEYANQEEARLRGLEVLKALPKPSSGMSITDLEELKRVAEIVVGQQKDMEGSRTILNVTDEDRKIGTKEAYYKSIFTHGFYFLGDVIKKIPNLYQSAKGAFKKIRNFIKDTAEIIGIMLPNNKVLNDYANKKFGFGNMALKDYFDDAYKHTAKVKKTYAHNNGGTIRRNMVYCELYMPVSILQKILYMQLTKQNQYDALILQLLQYSNKGLQEFIGKKDSPFKDKEDNKDNKENKKEDKKDN